MDGQGLAEVANPSALVPRRTAASRSAARAVFPAIEGTRPVLVEIQALIVRLRRRRHAAARGGRLGQRAAGDDPRGAGGALRARASRPRGLSQRRRRLSPRRSGRRPRGRGGAGLGAVRAAGAGRHASSSARSRCPARSARSRQAEARLKEAAKLGFAAGAGAGAARGERRRAIEARRRIDAIAICASWWRRFEPTRRRRRADDATDA